MTDILIIGAGPSGLFAGFYAGMRSMSTVIVDSLEVPGGQLAALYPEKYIYDVAGYEKIKAQELVDNLLKQLNRFEETTTFSLSNSVLDIQKQEDGTFIVNTSKGEFHTKSVILAAGNGLFAPRPLGVDGEDKYSNIHYFVNDLSIFNDRRVAIFGGGDSAVDWAIELSNNAKEVHIIHRRNEFRAHTHSVEELKKTSANILTPYTPKELFGEGELATGIDITNTETKDVTHIEFDDLVCNFGFTSNIGNIKDWNLELDGNKVVVDSAQRTNVEGVHAIGDICTYDGKASLIISGLGEAPVAVNGCFKHINPDAIIGALRSSATIKE